MPPGSKVVVGPDGQRTVVGPNGKPVPGAIGQVVNMPSGNGMHHLAVPGGQAANVAGATPAKAPGSDWRYLFRKVDAELKQKHKGKILTHLEVTHYSHMLKEQPILEENMHADGTIDKLITKALKTFEVLMDALML